MVVAVLIKKDSRIGQIGDPQVLVLNGSTRAGEHPLVVPTPEPDKLRAVRLTLFERPWQSRDPFRPVDDCVVEMSDVLAPAR
jgi:hypothetical protein